MISNETLMVCSCVLGIGWFVTTFLKNRQIAFEKRFGEIRAQGVQNRFDIYKNITDSEIERLNRKILLDSQAYANTRRDFQRFQEFSDGFHTNNARIPRNTVEAVKYAMKHAHPDNGGNAEDFIKLQKCYEELTRK